MPWQVIVGPKGVAAGKVEIKNRKTGAREELPIEQVAAVRLTLAHDAKARDRSMCEDAARESLPSAATRYAALSGEDGSWSLPPSSASSPSVICGLAARRASSP